MCLRDTSLKTGIGHNKITIAECSIVVTVLRLIVTNSLSTKWLYPNYTIIGPITKQQTAAGNLSHSMFRDKVNHPFHYFLQ